jgi:sporulation protein YlmC with PRC-barrel domain
LTLKQVIKELNGQDVGRVTQLDVDVTKDDNRGRQPRAKVHSRCVPEKSELIY